MPSVGPLQTGGASTTVCLSPMNGTHMAHQNADLLRRGYAAFSSGDIATLSEVFAEDITWIASGDTPLSGEFHGQEAVFGNFARIPELTSDFDMEVHDVLANDDHAVALVTMHVERDGKALDGNAVHIYHVDDGRVTSAWIVQEDQAAWDEFWAD